MRGGAGKGNGACGHAWSGEAVRAGATAVRGHVWPVDVAQARAPPPLATRWPVEVGAQARAPPHLATGGQYRWCGQEATVFVATRGRERRREQGQRSAWLRVVRRGGASKGNGARGHAWPREAARARTTDKVYTWPRVATFCFFARGHAWSGFRFPGVKVGFSQAWLRGCQKLTTRGHELHHAWPRQK